MSTAIEVSGLVMSYGDREVLRGVHFDVRAGEVFCLLGPNGAGKTTTVEILEGLRRRTGGKVSVLGLDPQAQQAGSASGSAWCLQDCGFPRQARVAELIDCWRGYYPAPATWPTCSSSWSSPRTPTSRCGGCRAGSAAALTWPSPSRATPT